MPPPPQPINLEEEQGKIEEGNFRLFREVLGGVVIERSKSIASEGVRKKKGRKEGKVWKGRKGGKNGGKNSRKEDERKKVLKEEKRDGDMDVGERDDREELGEFIDYLAQEIFTSLPSTLRILTYTLHATTPSLSVYTPPLALQPLQNILNTIPLSISETLATYLPSSSTDNLLRNTLNSYIEEVLKKPISPKLTKDKAEGCEVCGRDWIPLTYHHLIPRGMHAKVLRKGWWGEERLGDVAWVCRGCHSFIHSVATNEELAREYYSVERLLEREDVVAFAKWIGGVRWKAR